jgi:methionyl-tRNA synthetase
MGISFDIYSGTSINPYHAKQSQAFFTSLYEKGYFEKQSTRQFYDELKGVFLPDRYVKGECGFCGTKDQHGDQCENCGKMLDVDSLKGAVSVVSGQPAVVKETVHWFLDLARFGPQVEEWLNSAILRDHTKAYVTGLLATGLVKRAMTRDLSWGIPVPIEGDEAKGKVLYVWFDAPIGYISNTEELCHTGKLPHSTVQDWWSSKDTEIFHFIGEDNTIFHCVIWIAMLSAEGSFSLPKGVIVNQYLNFQKDGGEVEKISKSRGTAIWVEDLLDDPTCVDSVRYYLTAIAPERARSVYKPDDFILRHNGELADTLGNLVNRITSFTLKHCGDKVPHFEQERVSEVDKAFTAQLEEAYRIATEELEKCNFKSYLERAMEFARQCNRYVDEKAPWTMRKTDLEGTKVTLAYVLRAIHALGVLLSPVMPATGEKILAAFGRSPRDVAWSDIVSWNVVGAPLSQPPILFQKIVQEKAGESH